MNKTLAAFAGPVRRIVLRLEFHIWSWRWVMARSRRDSALRRLNTHQHAVDRAYHYRWQIETLIVEQNAGGEN